MQKRNFPSFKVLMIAFQRMAQMKITKIMLSTDHSKIAKGCMSIFSGERCLNQDFWLSIMLILQKLFSFSAPLEGACPSLRAQTTFSWPGLHYSRFHSYISNGDTKFLSSINTKKS